MSFSFGAGGNSTGSSSGGGGGAFSFGSSSNASVSSTSTPITSNVTTQSSNPPSASPFAFNLGGTSGTQQQQQPVTATTTAASSDAKPPPFSGFSFGTNATSTAPPAPTNTAAAFFGVHSASTTGNTSNDKPSFGATTTSNTGGDSKPAFSFGGATTAGDSTPAAFAFGGAPAASSSQGSSGGAFSFGSSASGSNNNNAASSANSVSSTSVAPPLFGGGGAGNFGVGSGVATTGETKAAGGGFNFGSANSTSSSVDSKAAVTPGVEDKLVNTDAQVATPVPKFGSANAATNVATTPASTGTGFSFGTSTPTPLTPGPPDPVATPGLSTPATTTGPTPTAPETTATGTTSQSTSAAPAPAQEPVRLEYQTLTVEQVLNMFQQEIEKDAIIYLEEARSVAERDAILRDSQRDLNMLTENVRRCLIEQKEVEQTLIGIGTFQSELDRNLDTVERNVDELFGAQSHLVPVDADQERETAYKLAHDVDVRLQELQTTVQNTMQQIELAEERALSGDVAKIVQVLNQHQRHLANLEDVARRMDVDIAHVNRVLTQR